jgi:hypothetical protein
VTLLLGACFPPGGHGLACAALEQFVRAAGTLFDVQELARVERDGLRLAYIEHPQIPVRLTEEPTTGGAPSPRRLTASLGEIDFTPASPPDDAPVRRLHELLATSDDRSLRDIPSDFAAVHYDPGRRRAVLALDKLGLRHLYFGMFEGCLLFSTAMDVFDHVDFFSKAVDMQAVAELIAFRTCFMDRTRYRAIRSLRPAEILEWQDGKITRRLYYRLGVGDGPLDGATAAEGAAEGLTRGVRARLGRDRSVISALSGGLDTRTVVSLLRGEGAAVQSINLSSKHVLEQTLSARYAAHVGTNHFHRVEAGLYRPQWSTFMAAAIADLLPTMTVRPERPHSFWSGDGGSTVGYVHLRSGLFRALREGGLPAVATRERFRERMAHALIKPEMQGELLDLIAKGLAEHVGSIDIDDIGRRYCVFYAEVRTRGVWSRHFEQQPRHGLEMCVPLQDAAVLEPVLRTDPEESCEHRLYFRMLDHLPADIREIPWQAYPGHEPCPLPLPPHRSQWAAETRATARARRRRFRREGAALLALEDFPHRLIDRRAFRTRMLAFRAGLYDGRALVDVVGRICDAVRHGVLD